MEFKEMQNIWNRQEDNNLYAINETALYAQIKQKGKSIDRKAGLFELIMIATNLIVGIVLFVDIFMGDNPFYENIFPAMYLIFSLIAVFLRIGRKKETAMFEPTMLGELDKAIWQVDYLIRQARSMFFWYVAPLLLVFSVMTIFNSKLMWGLIMLLIVFPASYFGSIWEVNKFYRPKKESLEALREKLVASPETVGME